MNVVFDIDGVILDTREQVREAYARAGVTQPPETFHQPWEQWLPEHTGGLFQACRIHKRKNQIYPKVLAEMSPRVLPAGQILLEYRGAAMASYLITSGSEEGIGAALDAAGLGFAVVLGYELDTEQKNKIFETKFQRPGVYVDDNLRFKLTAPGWRFVPYRGQAYTQLIEAIWDAAAKQEV